MQASSEGKESCRGQGSFREMQRGHYMKLRKVKFGDTGDGKRLEVSESQNTCQGKLLTGRGTSPREK